MCVVLCPCLCGAHALVDVSAPLDTQKVARFTDGLALRAQQQVQKQHQRQQQQLHQRLVRVKPTESYERTHFACCPFDCGFFKSFRMAASFPFGFLCGAVLEISRITRAITLLNVNADLELCELYEHVVHVQQFERTTCPNESYSLRQESVS